jgi:hypothetical protein
LLVLDLITSLQVLLLSFFKLIGSRRNADFLVHGFLLMVGATAKGVKGLCAGESLENLAVTRQKLEY